MKRRLCLGVVLGALVTAGCSVRRFAIAQVGNALSSGGSAYDSDDDIDLVGSALPFGLKLIESLLAEVPDHRGMLQTACQGFATYGYVYVQHEAELVEDTDFKRASEIRGRALRLYLRARRYGLRGLEASHPGIAARLDLDPRGALTLVKRKKDVPLLYWNAVALGLAISADRNDAAMLARLPEVRALIERALVLDPKWGDGTLHEFLVSFAASDPAGADYGAIQQYYRQALDLSGGKRAALHVAYAEAVWLPQQNKAEFRKALESALAIDPNEQESQRLTNLVAQRRAQFLLHRIDDLILETDSPEEEKLQ